VSPIGAGGMGEVYRGRDTRLDRSVAIKILPGGFAHDPQIRLRFEREAKTISALNHPNICTLFDVGHDGGTDFLVMELIEGETLAERLGKGALPTEAVLRIGSEIAGALDRAHRQGIVHRDLKPGNIMLTKSGAKLLDFGLARPGGAAPQEPRLSIVATAAKPLTEEGMIVGTFQYMAPEQLEGSDADARTDIFALGAVLYEMATGKRAFDGKSRTSLIAAIVGSHPPPISSVQQMSPVVLDHVVRKCLEKDPDDRWQSAHDVASELRWIAASSSESAAAVAPGRRRIRRREALAWTVAFLAVVGALASALVPRGQPPLEPVRLSLNSPPGGSISQNGGDVAISPDGRSVVFLGRADEQVPQSLFVRTLADGTSRQLPGTERASYPFWSPDSTTIAFFADTKLQKISSTGGAPEIICDAPDGRGGSWSAGGVIVFAPNVATGLMRVDARGGEPVEITRPPAGRASSSHRFPSFLPDGEHFLFLDDRQQSGTPATITIGSLGGETPVELPVKVDRAAVYAHPGYLIYGSSDRIVAHRFDPDRRELIGQPIPLPERPPGSRHTNDRVSSASNTGTLVIASPGIANSRLAWLNRKGETIGTVPLPEGTFNGPSLSPSGTLAALSVWTGEESGDVWIADLEKGTVKRLTFGAKLNRDPIWSPDSTRVVFLSDRAGQADLYSVAVAGGEPTPMFRSALWKRPSDWTSDGRFVLFDVVSGSSGYDIWLTSLSGAARPYLATSASEQNAVVSPNGRWIAYQSTESGRPEVFVQSFPTPGLKYQVTNGGGAYPFWAKGGRELLFGTANSVASIEVTEGETLGFGPLRMLFKMPRSFGIDVSPDGERFLVALPADAASGQSLTVVQNWSATLPK
jgi:serine/threonine protein kinase